VKINFDIFFKKLLSNNCNFVCKQKDRHIHHKNKKMMITKSQVAKIFLFIAMVACFSVQSLDSFKKYINQKTSFSVSYINKEAEPLPTFSICSEPPFNYEYLKTRNMTKTFFLSSYTIRLLHLLGQSQF
jgi:hypothetical protein